MDDLSLLRPVRNFLGLRLVDVASATGIRADRLSQAERGLTELRPSELTAVRDFLRARLADDEDDDRLLDPDGVKHD